MGEITQNSNFGIFGELTEEFCQQYENCQPISVGIRSTIQLGKAKIISNFSGEFKEYEIMIDRIYLEDTEDNKSFVIRIVDEELIKQTGGIIRGLSRKSHYSKWKAHWNCYQCIGC